MPDYGIIRCNKCGTFLYFPIRSGELVQRTKRCNCGRQITLGFFKIIRTFKARNNFEASRYFREWKRRYYEREAVTIARVGIRAKTFTESNPEFIIAGDLIGTTPSVAMSSIIGNRCIMCKQRLYRHKKDGDKLVIECFYCHWRIELGFARARK